MAKRAAGSGETPHRWRDRWRARVTVGFDIYGRQVQKAVYGRTMAECQERIDELRNLQAAGVDIGRVSPSVADYLEGWLQHKRLEVTFNTARDYALTLSYLLPLLGRLRLDKLSAQQVKKAQATIYEERSPRAARQALGLLRNALGDAEREDMVRRNVAQLVKPLKYAPATFPIWTAEEVLRFAEIARPCPHYALFRTGLSMGLRVGELMALDWRDLDGGHAHVQRTAKLSEHGYVVGIPKTDAANRVLRLPPDTIELLEWQHDQLDHPDRGLVFPTGSGGMANHSNLSRSLAVWCRRSEVTRIRVHDLRHTYASMRIGQGADPVTLCRELGHASASFTLDRYAHLFERARPRDAPSLADLTGSEASGVAPEEAGKVTELVNLPSESPAN